MYKIKLALVLLIFCTLTGCGGSRRLDEPEHIPLGMSDAAETEMEEPEVDGDAEPETASAPMEPVVREVDYSPYFNGMNGCAVFYTPADRQYDIYDTELAAEQRSPCSTFKIISSLLALQNGIIDPQQSVRPWSMAKEIALKIHAEKY